MPDLTEQTFWACQTAIEWSTVVVGSTGDNHVVRWGFTPEGDTEYAYSCDCKGFKYRKRCSHVKRAKERRCGWTQFVDGGEPHTVDGKHFCPECGGPVVAQRFGV